ncbi:hypothetical protein CANCADRAFT_92612 [Tortispora caseinolytica NRRL Y-17796]|uniref:Trafficking protein particle complex subunit 6B n=1 Tax=Tortispora caseinolytica NRRL Y-17796 TaxID=767744 RepID=A0A1E4TLV7_9ASCO|nr:hypothetical protein CANCADRAFT_92612 [Tortispora caseinolytica NRRL Y-17796]
MTMEQEISLGSEPHAMFVSYNAFDLILGELVPQMQEVSQSVYGHTNPARIEQLGWRVGLAIVERFGSTKGDTLEIMKFICKDVWLVLFRKQIDNLKTNHRGVYVLTDTQFRLFQRMSRPTPSETIAMATPYLEFPAGIIRGILEALGVKASVKAETPGFPTVVFHITTMH